MEILQQFKQNGYFTVDLYHLLATKKIVDSEEEIIPSQYVKEMKLSSQERLKALDKIEADNIICVGRKPDKIVLAFTPRVIVFQNFKPNDKLVAKFSVKNISKSPTYLNMVYKESSLFFVKPCGGQLLSRLAPGISVTFAVTFAPEQFEDYIHRVTFYTDKDQYVLPLIAMGPRPVFDFPDEIIMPKVALKVESNVSVVINNIGIVPAGFRFRTRCPFTVQPKSIFLNPREKIEVKVTFKTMHVGPTEGALYALFETGENFKIKLSGTTHPVSIEMEKQVVRFQDTYNTMVRQQNFKITNKSPHVLTYMCMKNDHIYNDFEEKVHLASRFYNLKKSEAAKCQKLVQYDVLSSDEHERVYTRIFYDEVHALVADETLHFQDTHFSITPIKGQLWPNKATELVIIFNPKAIGEFKAVAYLDVDGVSNRLPLFMVGTSLPPAIHLNLETLNMDRIYINKLYNYEIVAMNKGHINGVVLYKDVPTLFGSRITCSPELHCLRPGEKEAFVISFSNSNQGPYFEEINFVIRDSDVLLKLYLKGEVIYPSLMFSIPCLDFGMVSVGVPKTMELEVINESIVTVNASVKISSDGPEVSSIRLIDYAVADMPKPEIPKWPREFDIEPSKIELLPESRVSIKVILTANLIRANQTSLELELEKSDSPPIILPVTFDARIPEITPAADITLRACFLDFPYKQEIQVLSNEFRGYFTVENQNEDETLRVTIGVKEGIIEPNSTITFPVTIVTGLLGVQEHMLRLNMFGLSKSIDICHITGCGVRPIVTCTPSAVHWGQVKLLTKSRKTLTLCNDSPVYVNFKASLLNRDGRWIIQPSEGFVEPESETELVLTLYLLDADTYTNKAVIQLEKVKDILVPLSATGVGTSILVGELRDRVILGRHFTRIPLQALVTLENCGTRMHALEWSEHYKAPKTKPLTTGFFNLEPKSFKMAAGEKITMTVTAISHKVATIKEMWYLVGSVEGINKKELLLECQIVAEFVDPKIEVSSTVMEFQYDYGPYSEYYKLTDIVTIKNVSKLPLDMDITVKPPFAIIQKQNTYKIEPRDERMCCCISYNESDLNIQSIRNESGEYQSKIFIDYLTLKPVEPLRKGPLNFFQDINKIKMAFNLTHAVEERLEDQEIMKLQILFDIKKHVNLKSRVYCELMRNKFKGHKNKDTIKLIGKINFPNMFVENPRVDFQCILNGSIESKTIQIQNVTPLLVCYRFQWKKIVMNSLPVPELPSMKYSEKSISETSTYNTESEPNQQSMTEELQEILSSQTACHSPREKLEGNETGIKEQGGVRGLSTVADVDTTSLDAIVEPELELVKTKTIQRISPMLTADYDLKFLWMFKFPKLSKHTKSFSINEVLQLMPHRGILKPNECQHVHVIFSPKPNMNVRAVLECEVLGGPPEYVVVTGQSSDLRYKLNTHKLNFKIRSFHENASERLYLSNNAQLVFEYKTYLNEPKFENELQGTILNVVPDSKVLEHEEEADIQVVMRPGVVGFFNRVFILEIGHLPHTPIEVFGWGVIPQVYISLYRPDIINLHPELGYGAIPTLTQEYMEAVSEIFMRGPSEHVNSPEIEKCFEDPDLQSDWHICSVWDGYPSIMDIELAIERMLVIEYIKLRPEILTAYSTTSKMGPIPGFHTTPYVIDFGVVITGSTVQCVAEIINYGPIVTKLHFAKGTQIPTWLGVKLSGKLNPGESGKIEVTFSPTSISFTELEQDVETSFNLEVPYGITIPIKIKALCAVPYLTSNVSIIDFGSVRCGDKIICSIPLKNVGRPTCIWYVTLRLKAPGNNPMMVLDSSGKYEPGEGGWLSIAFKPTTEMTYEAVLIFRFHMNPNKMTIPVIGHGITPHVHVVGPNVSFPPTLPWADTTDIYFGLTNPCPFPLELIFAHSDEKWKEEDEIYNLLYKYYNKPEEMLVPAIRPGAGFPEEILVFYKKFAENVKKSLEEEAAAARADLARASQKQKQKVTKATPKGSAKGAADKADLVPVRKHRTEAEIIADEIRIMKENNMDPLKECLHVLDNISTKSGTDERTKGLIVFFHGSPCEEVTCQEMAYTIGMRLNLPTVNIDLCIVDALCTSSCEAKQIIVTAIDETFQVLREGAKDDENDGECSNGFFGETEDEFDVMAKKITYLANSKNVGTPRSKISDKKKKKSPTSSAGSHTALGAMGSVTMFHMDLIQELLTDYFAQPKFQRGFVVDSLTSIILKNPPLVLTTVLKCKRSIWNVHLILCQSDFAKWLQAFEEAQRESDMLDQTVNKVYAESEIDEIIDQFQDMDDEEYENASPELRTLYVAYGLEERRRKHLESLGNFGLASGSTLKKDKSNRTAGTDSILAVNTSDSKKKTNKKEEGKGKPTNEVVLMSTKYNEYNKTTYENLINLANNWLFDECDIGFPLYGFYGQVLGNTQKKSNKKKSEIQLQASDVSFKERGFPLTLVMCPCLHYKDALVNMFTKAPLVQEVLKEEEDFDILKCPMKRKEFTVLLSKTMPNIQHEKPLTWYFLDEMPIKKCECNQLTDLNLLDDTTQDNILNILSKWHCSCGKKLASSQTSTSDIPSTSLEKVNVEESEIDFYPRPLPLRSVKSLPAPGGRLVLQPGDLVRCKYSFSPQWEGHFSVKRFVEVSGWPESRIDINISGICDLPRIDSRPKKMFENFVRRTVEDNVYKITYLDDLKVFEFGPIFIGANRIYEEEYTLDLKNSSLITANVDIEFQDDTTIFELDTNFIMLEPGCRGKLTITAAPAEVGVHSVVLLFCVKDNPEIVTVNIACSGVVPVVEILPLLKRIEYGKLLLYRRGDDRFIVKNDSILPIMWKVRNTEDFVEDFIIAQTTGIVLRHDNQVVPVTYIACQVGVISNKSLIIDIYDSEGRGNPMVIDQLFLSAECYDVMVECAFEVPTENLLNYGNVKVNSTVSREMYLLNRGKYNIYFRLKKVKNFPEPSLLKGFQATPECGLLPYALKLVPIEFECTPTTSMNLVNVPAYTCTLLDGSKEQVVVAKFPVCVTIASFYNTFTLFPLGELNFNIIAVGSGVIREVILNNTSKCPVTYEIILPPEHRPDPLAPPASAARVGKDNKIKVPPLKCGNFLIINEDNLLAPGTSRTIQIQFMATAARKFEETINFVISDTCPAEANGVPLRLVGIGAMPTLDFWNIENTFREHLILKNLSEYKIPESSPHCVFVEDSVSLYFFSVTVDSKFSAAIDLYNNGFVPCALTMKLHYQGNSNQDIFSLDKYETHIESLQHKCLGIIFTPKALMEYRAVLEVQLKLLDNQQQSFKICLIGEGVIPRIRMIWPPIKQHKISLLRIPVTCLGSVSNQEIRFKNISSVKSLVKLSTIQSPYEERQVFWLTATDECEKMVVRGHKDEMNIKMQLLLKPAEIGKVVVHYNPVRKGKTSCEIRLAIATNPYEYFTVFCEAEAFMEDVILIGLEMLSMDADLEAIQSSNDGTRSSISTNDSKKKPKSANVESKRSKITTDHKKTKRSSISSMKHSDTSSSDPSFLKYLLDFGGCELGVMQKRSVVMLNNSEKVYKFIWEEVENLVVKPSIGYISPGEEKDLEIIFFSVRPVTVKKELVSCMLNSISDESLTLDIKGSTWDNRQTVTVFGHNKKTFLNERIEEVLEEQAIEPGEGSQNTIKMMILYSAVTEYIKYTCTLNEKMDLRDTYIYQTRKFDFTVKNVGRVPMKIVWGFNVDEEFPARTDKHSTPVTVDSAVDTEVDTASERQIPEQHVCATKDESKVTLFSGSRGRESVDTWFEVDLPFEIVPSKECIAPNHSKVFTVTFAPLDAFNYRVNLKSWIENLDAYDRNISCRIKVKSLIPYCHLDIEESDYITAGRRKTQGVVLPPFTTVLEFNVLGSGCYKKSFNVINPTTDGYEFIFEMVVSDKPELVPVHCNMLKGYVEGGTSTEVTFTFAPTAPGTYESQWKFVIPVHNLVIHLLVVGLVREPDVAFVPTILLVRNSLVGFTTTDTVILKNDENESLKFEFKGNSMCNELGKTPVTMEPESGTLKPRSETPIKFIYTPILDGPLSFKIFCSITYMTKYLTLCVNALSNSIKPKVTYFLIGNEHVLNSEATTNIHLDQTASTYERTLTFIIKNDGSATFFFDWSYNCSAVKKYLQVFVEPREGHVAPGADIECTLHFTLKQVPVQAFPVTLHVSDGPVYNIFLHSEVEKPLYHFSCSNVNFGKCIVNAPDTTYRKSIAFHNDDKEPITLDLDFTPIPELLIDYHQDPSIAPHKRTKICIFFRPKQVKEYEFRVRFWVDSLCEEIITVQGEGVPLLFDLYEGCQKSFDMGAVKVGEKAVHTIEVMNYSKVAIDATFVFRDMYPEINDDLRSETTSVCLSPNLLNDVGPTRVKMLKNYKDDKIRDQIAMDIQNALSSLKVIPKKCTIKPFRKVPLKIQMKPVGLISNLCVQLNMQVLNYERPLVKLSGSATGMSLCLSQNSLQFGRVRIRGCKILKVMLLNKGDFGARFWWQPLISNEFTISPMYGHIAAHTNVTFTITFRPVNHNPFIKIWACCNIENYIPLELAMYATCVDMGMVQPKSIYMECPVREVKTEYVSITNPSDEMWLILSEMPHGSGPFSTLKEFVIEPNSVFDVPIHFKPQTMGKHESQIFYSPLGESALFITLIGAAGHPNPNGTIHIILESKAVHTENLLVRHITELPETYHVSTEIDKIIPDKFDGFYDIQYPDTVQVWGETCATCRWNYVCYGVCEMHMKVVFVHEQSKEYQYYNIVATVTASQIVDTMRFTSRARETVSREITIRNPLDVDADFAVKCGNLHGPSIINIPRRSESTLQLSFSPLVVGDTEEEVEISNPLIGTYVYKVILRGLPAKAKELEVSTPLGTSIPLRVKVQNRTDVRAEFTSSVTHPSILTVNKEYSLGPFEKGKFLIMFEPTELGVQQCRLSFASQAAGEFTFNIKGKGMEPKPQGPIEIKAGGYAMITFKNVFMETVLFKMTVDRQEFYIKTLYEPIQSKKELKIPVYLSERAGSPCGAPPTGCLTVERYDPAEPRAHWTYFLQGIP